MESKDSLFNAMMMYRPKGGGKAGTQQLMMEMSEVVKNNFPYPILANWLCNAKCNYKCFYCPLNAPNYHSKEEELSTEKAEALIDEIVKSGARMLIINGGEPLLREDLCRLIRYATAKGLEVTSLSNMSLMPKEVALNLKEAGLSNIIVSLDAGSKETYFSVKRVDCFNEVLENIRSASAAGIGITATMGVTRDNEHEFESFVELCIANNIPNAIIWMPIASNKENVKRVLNAQERHELFKKVYHFSEKLYNKIALVAHPCDGQWIRVLLELTSKNIMENFKFKTIANMSKGCMASTYMVGLSLEGNIFPCGATMGDKGESLGNIFKDGLLHTWNHSDILLKIRNRELKGKCNNCDYKKICGGCRVAAWLSSGDYLESDPTCVHALDDPLDTGRLYVRV